MFYGYAGRILRVNLTSFSIRKEALDGGVARRYLGGRGLGAKILFEELKPRIDPLRPENKLILATGMLTGIHFLGITDTL